MTRFFLGDNGFQAIDHLLVGGVASEEWLEVVFPQAEESGSYLPIGSEPEAIAVSAEGLRDRRNQTEFRVRAVDAPTLGCFG